MAWIEGGGSLTRRPDAISLDYLTCWSVGPIALSDNSAGPLARVWQLRVDGLNVMIAKENDTKTGWLAEQLLFSYTGAPIIEVDLAFDQNGAPVVCAERYTGTGGTSEVWLYRYDSVLGAYEFTVLAPGRTPRVMLDEYTFLDQSDVLVFYINPAQALVYRQQRDRYNVELATPATYLPHGYIEDVAKGKSSRVIVLVAQHDPVTGQYSVRPGAASSLYPILVGQDGVTAGADVLGVLVKTAFIELLIYDSDKVTVAADLLDISVRSLITEWLNPWEDSVTAAADMTDVSVRSLIADWSAVSEDFVTVTANMLSVTVQYFIIQLSIYDVEKMTAGADVTSVSVVLVIIQHSIYDKEQVTVAADARTITIGP